MSVGANLRGAMLLAAGRAEGARRLDGGEAGALRSFLAILLCLPAFAGLRALEWRIDGWPARLGHAAMLEGLGFIVGWLGFAVALHAVLRATGHGRAWYQAITAWNWCNVVQFALALLASVPDLARGPPMVGETTTLVAFGWGLWIEWYAFRVILDAPLLAVGLATLDFLFGQVVAIIVMHLT